MAKTKPTTWVKLKPQPPPVCDICDEIAVWKHPQGGLRCAKCPRPEPKKEEEEVWTCERCGLVVPLPDVEIGEHFVGDDGVTCLWCLPVVSKSRRRRR